MSEKYVLSIDQGTTSTRAALFSKRGSLVAIASAPLKQIYPEPGWVEHDPEDIWRGVTVCIRDVLDKARITPGELDCVGVTNQRETALVWERDTGKPVCNAIVWQCRRTARECETMKRDGTAEILRKKTGLVADAYFSASKVRWILNNVPGAREKAERGRLAFGTVDAFILFRLSGGKIFRTDYTNASRTMLFNAVSLSWDEELAKLFSVPESMFPEVCPSSYFYGFTDKSVFGASVPITGVAGDQQSSLYGHLCLNPGSVKCTYGTGCFLLMNTGGKFFTSGQGLITSLAAGCADKPSYCLEGSVFIGGAVVQWLRDEMGLISSAYESEKLAFSVPDSNGVYFVPAFAGLGAPYWDGDARGLICGITRGTTKAHIVRAALEAVAFEVTDVLSAMRNDSGMAVGSLEVDGGAAENNFLMQFQADVCGVGIARPKWRK